MILAEPSSAPSGVGLGLRRALMSEIADVPHGQIDFLELAPENWIGVGGRFGRQFRALAERYPILLHGLSLDIGGTMPLQIELLQDIKQFMAEFNCSVYSEHLTFCRDDGQLYDLMPIPFTEEAVHYVAERIRVAQDILGQRIALENASYYAAPGQEMTELAFIAAVLAEADCELLLDVNNIYVNSVNHGYCAGAFLSALPHERVRYIHIAGHTIHETADAKSTNPAFLIDTHGAAVVDPVWDLLAKAYEYCGNLPTLLERDVHFPSMNELMAEVDKIRDYQLASHKAASFTSGEAGR